MGNVQAGKLVDPETEESLAQVETVLSGVGIKLRDSNSEFREFGDVLDDVAANWEDYGTVQQRAIAVAFSGTRQQEKFLILMENYEDAMRLAGVSAESIGTASEKYNVYLNSMEAKTNSFTSAVYDLSDSLINSDIAKFIVDIGTAITKAFTWSADTFGALPTLLATLGGGILLKNLGLTRNDELHIGLSVCKCAA